MKLIRLLFAAVLLCGCAKFPPAGATNGFAKITFTMKVRGRIHVPTDVDPSFYLYYVGMTASTSRNPDYHLAPLPVVSSQSQNGFMAGSPTHFVLFNSQNPQGSQPFTLFQFAPNVAPNFNSHDPNNPINLQDSFESSRARITDYHNLSDDPTSITFSLYANALANNDTDAKGLQTLLVNFLTMNRNANGAGSSRIIDSLGNQLSNVQASAYVTVDLTTDGTYSNDFGSYQGLEPPASLPSDTLGGNDPDLDIVDWSITVTH